MRRRLRDHNALVARHESAYNKAQEDGRMMEGRLPQLKEQAAQADREAADAAKQAQHHSDGEGTGLFRSLVAPGFRLPSTKEGRPVS